MKGVKPILNLHYMKQCIIALVCLLAFSCSSTYQISTLNHDPKVTVIDNEFQLDRLLRKDFKFRWNFAQYAMSQPYGWYMSNYSFNRWRPYSTFDIYWNSTQYWTDWAFNYPFHSNYYSWNRPYWGWNTSWWNGPWQNPGYNVVWNRSQRNSVAYINGRRGSNNIQNKIVLNNTNKPRTVTINKPRVIINKPRVVVTTKPRTIINKPRPRINTNPRVYVRPSTNNNSRPVYNNTSTTRSSSPPTTKRGGK